MSDDQNNDFSNLLVAMFYFVIAVAIMARQGGGALVSRRERKTLQNKTQGFPEVLSLIRSEKLIKDTLFVCSIECLIDSL